MKILFINIYPSHTIARYLLSGYVLKGYLLKNLPEGKVNVEILNFPQSSSAEKIVEKARAARPDLIAYSCYIWNIELVLRLVEKLKVETGVVQVLGGPEIVPSRIESFTPEQQADYFVVGEGENALLNLIRIIRENPGRPLENLPKGVAAWREGKLKYKENRDFIRDLDRIPSIYLEHLIEDRLYHKQQAFLETQRGCRFKCKYCVYHKGVTAISHFSVERVNREIDYLFGECKISALRIFDADFVTNLERSKGIVRHMLDLKNSGVQLPWIYWEFTYFKVDEEFLRIAAGLKDAENILNTQSLPPKDRPQHYNDLLKGYTAINCIGIQSFHKPSQLAVGRFGIHPDKFRNFMDGVRRYNLVLKIDLILGLPLETFQTYFAGLEYLLPFLRKTDHVLNIHRLQILPGSDLEFLCGKYGIDFSRTAPHMVYSTSTLSREEFQRASKLTGLLFRMVNSPLRENFFQAWEDSGMGLAPYLEKTLKAMEGTPETASSKLVCQEEVDDDYWNDEIFYEVPSRWLGGYLRKGHGVPV